MGDSQSTKRDLCLLLLGPNAPENEYHRRLGMASLEAKQRFCDLFKNKLYVDKLLLIAESFVPEENPCEDMLRYFALQSIYTLSQKPTQVNVLGLPPYEVMDPIFRGFIDQLNYDLLKIKTLK